VMIECVSYDYLVNGFLATITLTNEGMTAGRFYQFSYTAKNRVGASTASSIVTVPVADYPLPPAAISRTASSRTSISVAWDKVADTQLPAGLITGYRLFMDNGLHGDFVNVYNTQNVLINA